MKVWDVGTGREVVVFRGHEGRRVTSVAWREGEQIASAGCDGVKVWRAVCEKKLKAKAKFLLCFSSCL